MSLKVLWVMVEETPLVAFPYHHHLFPGLESVQRECVDGQAGLAALRVARSHCRCTLCEELFQILKAINAGTALAVYNYG